MSRKTYRWIDGELVLVAENGVYKDICRSEAPMVVGDLPGYESPVSGKWIEGRKARREDLARTHSRPWEGIDQERKEAAKVQRENERKLDQLAEKMAHRMWDQAPERARKQFRGK